MKMKNALKKVYSFLKTHAYIVSVLATIGLFFLVLSLNKLYPFSNVSIAWCDMVQQVIPLLNQFKDILQGKQSFFMNYSEAGGMSFFAVFFFFLSSPFSLLVVFVKKTSMEVFMNILMLVKVATISFCCSFFLNKKFKSLPLLANVGLSLAYALSSYNMMYYQNIIWLDEVYLFPLLLLSLDYLIEKKKFIPYLIAISAVFVMNYYIGMMVVFFTIMYMAIRLLTINKDERGPIAKAFLIGSFFAALICAVVYIPSFIEYAESARTVSFIENIKKSWFLTNYSTTLPSVFTLFLIIPFAGKINKESKVYLILLILLSIPLVVNPINDMWHLGSYQAFPSRYAFMNIMLGIILVCYSFTDMKEKKAETKLQIALNALVCIVTIEIVISLYYFEYRYLATHYDYLKKYATSLWGNQTYLEALLRYYLIIAISLLVIRILGNILKINKEFYGFALTSIVVLDVLFSAKIYMTPSSRSDASYVSLYEASEIIQDDSFYRVKTPNKNTDVNNIGGMGYNTISHYTSLTNKDFMFTMKKLGYSSYWMEIGAYGGTSFTDAIMVNKYTLKKSDTWTYTENKVYPLGIITESDLSNEKELKEDTRMNMQNHIYDELFGGSIYTNYPYTSLEDVLDVSDDLYRFNNTTTSQGYIKYKISIEETQKLYFDAFDVYSNSLTEHINDSLAISVNGRTIASSYPTKSSNGALFLGEFSNSTVEVSIQLLKNIYAKSFNVYGVSEAKLDESISSCTNESLKVSKDKISGTYNVEKDSYIFISLPYSNGYKAKINGKTVKINKVFSTFMALKLTKGENKIEITYTQPGLIVGGIVSIVGLAGLITYIVLNKKKKISEKLSSKINKLSYPLVIAIGVIVFIAIYILPLIINGLSN